MAPITKTPVMVLQELTIQKGFAPPDFQIVFSNSGTHENRFDYMVAVAGITASGTGPSKQVGKHDAAHNALKILEEMGIYKPSENPVAEFKVPFKESGGSPFKTALNCIVELQNICIEKKIPAPEFNEVSSVGPPHAKEFTFECKIASIMTEAKANTKKLAKQLAAKEMLERMKDLIPDLIDEFSEVDRALKDKDSEAISSYNEMMDIIPDKSVKMDELPYTLKKLMDIKNLRYEDFREDLQTPSEENLKKILDRLEVGYEILPFQENPPLAALILKIDTPFVIIGKGESFEKAKEKALSDAFIKMDFFMQLD
ncbi:RISC-loading complex subunit tarbp2-like [Sitophilus oryzae]|uniref:RISC-loading complex subunit tarbp2-like n=1 Tax=Sitophilus oryzae TaxID=7048 RepID=A0A6J2YD07_SITOR|nr:RISC-loading complex subunit tarbp2-like [Sitophilus oryzae]